MKNNHDDQKVMLVTGERLLYSGLVGRRMRPRRMGAASLYVAPIGGFQLKVADQPWEQRTLALLPPYIPHRVASPCGKIINVLIETEHVSASALAEMMARFNQPGGDAGVVDRVRRVPRRLLSELADTSLNARTFDALVMGTGVGYKALDPRIEVALEAFGSALWRKDISAADYARSIGLSASRFLHLFKKETGTSFRNHRMWKRARNFLNHANCEGSLTDLAFDLGYPDSSHFSHSIRKTFGLQPRSIRLGSRGLKIVSALPA
ncbi:helix-turn-helix domain-containing protein [Alcanivorax xiamenensis]|uniref:Helix-turn-helix domain-containing protein n=1 Tax=Alcanivorax xiamenensis TaxID=1177156 RepID=A0ABQ6YBZ7_9GAMM|nr:helix-turn-helix transcriptional regulator [Alcanivorax xiamenensis]KAF0807651.1 helix-turn-helix domain-containing protein [Alcanivorax xiamenensis]